MKKKKSILALMIMTAVVALQGCSGDTGNEDSRNRIIDITDETSECNTRVANNGDDTEISVRKAHNRSGLTDTRNGNSDNPKENGMDIDGSLIDVLIKLKRR